MIRDLRGFLEQLEEAGELIRIGEELSPKYEVAAAVKYVAEKKGTAVLFERVKGYDVPVVGNLFGSRKRLAMAFGVAEDEVQNAYRTRRGDLAKPNVIQPKEVSQAPVQEVVIDHDVDILKAIPVLTCHENDVSPYFTSTFTIIKDPETGIQAAGLHRIQVKDRDTIGVFLASPPLCFHAAKGEEMNKPLEIAVVSGAEPLTFFGATLYCPGNIDKFAFVGGLAQAPVEVVRGCSVDLMVPANAQFVLEGELIPRLREPEGPFGESSGYYFAYNNPVAKIKTITHRNKPIYHAIVPFGSEDETLLSVPWEVNRFMEYEGEIPCLRGINYRNLSGVVIVQIDKKSEEDVKKTIDLFFSHWFTVLLIITDVDVDIRDPRQVDWALATRVRPERDITVKSDQPAMTINPVAVVSGEITLRLSPPWVPLTAKIAIDATKPLEERERFERIDIPQAVKEKVSTLLQGSI